MNKKEGLPFNQFSVNIGNNIITKADEIQLAAVVNGIILGYTI